MASAIRRMAVISACVAVLTMGGTVAARAEFKSGPWIGNAYAQKDGKFERCVITSEQPNGLRLGFGKSIAGAFEIWLINKAWKLEPGTPQKVSLWVDNEDKRQGTFQTVSAEAMAAQFPTDKQLVDALKRGSVLHLVTPTGQLDLKLTGTFKAIGELEQCWAQNTGRTTAAAPAAPKRVKGMDLLSLTPRDFAGQVITSKNDGFFSIPETLPEQMKRWNAALVWLIKDGVGLSSGVGSNPDVEALRDNLVQQKKPKCKGEMSSSTGVQTLAGTTIQVKRVEIRCSDIGDGSGVTEVFTFYPHLSGQLLVVSHISSNHDAALKGDQEFTQRATAILKAK